jgi:medium-chain acyl-[acyl-carrier-protein] hydrolase
MIKKVRDPWFPFNGAEHAAPFRLFCFSHAGGSAMVFRPWQKAMAPAIEVFLVQLPGRGGRAMEPLATRMPALADMTTTAVAAYIDRPFAFFGHSMGALLAFEVAQRLRARRGVEPVHLFISGRRGPERPPTPIIHTLSHDDLVERLQRLKGTPAEVLEHPELLELVVPIFRADVEVLETYEFPSRPPLSCPVTAMGGLEDVDVKADDLEAWKQYSTGEFKLRMFAGDHFYLLQPGDQVVNTLKKDLMQYVGGPAVRQGV